MSQVVFSAKNRTETGSGEARRIRRAGRIPAVVYGRSGKALSIDLDALEFVNNVKGISESTIVTINVDGQVRQAFVKDTQRNITDGKILHVDFYEVEAGISLRAKVSVHVHGNPVGVREGGILESPLHDIEVECLPKDLPERIDVDIAELKVNQSIHVRDLKLGEGVRLISNPDQVVALVKFAKAETEAAAETEGAAETTETKEPAKEAKA
ncbi:MAG: 50S ribosomal protein L25 [Treponema sp.]|jgi:large subunit ribosomal protein L25|nr:50S ribosomal protein L25 [Treponema sp.]